MSQTLTSIPPKPPTEHDKAVAQYSGELLEDIIADLSKRNLRDFKDHEVRWSAQRLKACRAERRRRKEAFA